MTSKSKSIRSSTREKLFTTSSSGLPKWRQSPVDISRVAVWTKRFPPLLLTNYWSHDGAATLTNTGKTVNIELVDRKMPTMRGGPLRDDEFQFRNVQFRWGPCNSYGAEHSIDNVWYSMEAQVMHWNIRYGSIEKCYEKPDGIATLSYLMQVVGCSGIPDNPALSPITEKLSEIKRTGSSVNITPDCLRWMMHALMCSTYYTYSGSLTFPPYNECVTWIILPNAIKISLCQIEAFRSLYNYKWEHIVRNYRSQRPLRGRRIFLATDDALD
ncbi:carbonic anhydrase 2-like [Harpegnathos saltator]|uniref:carbonic anhydrase 2-like n=1 Tax=Harpegnathos saltator TaxID=610380 RepID=UPI00058D64F0|nr:carbonic anhydrase 2-like [Harpegnathos saltator]